MNIDAQIRQLIVEKGWGRTRIMRALPGVSEYQIKKIIREERPVERTEHDPSVFAEYKPHTISNFSVVTQLRPIQFAASAAKQAQLVNPEHSPTYILFGDIQAPFQSDENVAALCSLIRLQKETRLDGIINVGDGCDFYTVSDYNRDPARRNQLQDELISAADVNYKITESAEGVTDLNYISGNHEARLARYIEKHAPALASLPQLKVPSLLGLSSLGWKYHEDYFMLKRNFLVKHGEYVTSASAATAKREMESAWMSGASGHTHRLGVHYRTTWRHALMGLPPEVWIETGCLCAPDPEYMKGKKSNWQPGAVIVSFPEGIAPSPTVIGFHNGRFEFNHKIYEAT
jgi:hypothetical protein